MRESAKSQDIRYALYIVVFQNLQTTLINVVHPYRNWRGVAIVIFTGLTLLDLIVTIL